MCKKNHAQPEPGAGDHRGRSVSGLPGGGGEVVPLALGAVAAGSSDRSPRVALGASAGVAEGKGRANLTPFSNLLELHLWVSREFGTFWAFVGSFEANDVLLVEVSPDPSGGYPWKRFTPPKSYFLFRMFR